MLHIRETYYYGYDVSYIKLSPYLKCDHNEMV